MTFLSEIKRIFSCDCITISERMDTAETPIPFVVTKQNLYDKEALQSLFTLVPARDTLVITFTDDSGDLIRVSSKQPKFDDFVTFIDKIDSDDTVEVQIQIDKTVLENKFSIYHFESFAEHLLERSLVEVLRWFSKCLASQEYILFIVFDHDISFSTGTMAFGSNNNISFSPKINRAQRLTICKEMAYFYNMNTFEIIPDDFCIGGLEQSDNKLKPLFEKITTIVSLIYVSSSASISDTTLHIQVSGQRTSSYALNLNTINANSRWQSIYAWIYTDGNPTDKTLIAHNVISLHCKYTSLLDIDDKVLDAIKSNYKLYLRSNVDQYLALKKDISKFIQNVVAQVGDYAISILNKFKANLIAVFVFIFTVVLTRIGSTQKWEDIFTKHTIYLIEIVLLGSLVYLIICFFETRYKLQKTRHAYNELKENYKDVLAEEEIKDVFKEDSLLKGVESSVNKGMKGWAIVWGVILISAVLAIEVLTENKGVFVWVENKISGLISNFDVSDGGDT